MSEMIDHEVRPNLFYVHNEVHRNRTPNKGQWTISQLEERQVFGFASDEKWLGSDTGWGLHLSEGKAAYLGIDRDGFASFFSLFIDKQSTNRWHGFPATPLDTPSEPVLKNWLDKGLVRKKVVRMLSRGELCSL